MIWDLGSQFQYKAAHSLTSGHMLVYRLHIVLESCLPGDVVRCISLFRQNLSVRSGLMSLFGTVVASDDQPPQSLCSHFVRHHDEPATCIVFHGPCISTVRTSFLSHHLYLSCLHPTVPPQLTPSSISLAAQAPRTPKRRISFEEMASNVSSRRAIRTARSAFDKG